jgi:hypothetical protein
VRYPGKLAEVIRRMCRNFLRAGMVAGGQTTRRATSKAAIPATIRRCRSEAAVVAAAEVVVAAAEAVAKLRFAA